jgi:glycosyltransferase involved in cell wall biosynthesis
MKVVQINSVSGFGSTGSICVDIALELERQGHECYIAYGQITKGYSKEFKIGTKLENNLHNVGSRLLGKQGYFTKSGTRKLVKFIKEYKPDVIHLHNLHGNYLNLEIIFDYLIKAKIPVVWTLHDCWAFTGKCAHFTDVQCFKWQIECNNCPQLSSYPLSLFFDFTKEMYFNKKKWFTSLNSMKVITVSNWLAGEVEASFLNKYPIQTIYNWVDHTVFKESVDNQFALNYSLDSTKFTIVLVSAGWNLSDVKWIDALKLAQIIDADMQILMIGKVSAPQLLPNNIQHIPYLEGREELAKAYSFADVYVHLSTEDTFGKVIAEAMSCGTPAIVYNTTACPEILGEECGYVVDQRNVEGIYEKIKSIQNRGKAMFSINCRTQVIKNFDLNTNIQATIKVYQELKYSHGC